MPSVVNFWHQQDSNSLFKGSIDHVTSSCKWPISRRLYGEGHTNVGVKFRDFEELYKSPIQISYNIDEAEGEIWSSKKFEFLVSIKLVV